MTRNLGLIVMLLLLGGCSWFSWLPWVGDSEKDAEKALLKPAPLTKYEATVNVRRLWKAGVGDGLGRKYLKLQPALLADRIYAADGYGRLEAFDRFTGKRQWRVQLPDESGGGFLSGFNFIDRADPSFVSGGVGAGAGMVFLGTTDGEVIAFSAADGEERWRTRVDSEVLAPPVTGQNLVFVQTIDGSLVALEARTGAIRWELDNQVPVLTLRGTSTPVYTDGVVYAGFADGKLLAVKADKGEPAWEHRVMLPEGRSELDRMVDVDATPLIDGPLIYVVSYQGNIQGLRRSDGALLWEQKMSSFLDLDMGYGQIYVVDQDDTVIAIDRQTAEIVWSLKDLARRRLSAPVAFSNYIAVTDDEGYLHIIAQSDGRLLGRRKLDGDGVRSRMVYADGTLYALGNSGSLQALEVVIK
ncbi:MAG: outer membrane protein assembly factor BamB [Pseudomonadales bacterium]|nr:outer membrane protein assembly factor BamB [Pseudomonadales bacterium]